MYHFSNKINLIRIYLRYYRYYSKFRGNNFFCPLCRTHSKYFYPLRVYSEINIALDVVPNGFRDNVICPKCYSADRERLLYIYFIIELKIHKLKTNINLLHIAPEIQLSKKLQQFKQIFYISCDLNNKFVRYNFDIRKIPFKTNSFDIIICNHVLEHIMDDITAMKEIFRVLKKNGLAFLLVPLGLKITENIENKLIKTNKERLDNFGQINHVRLYSKKGYIERLEEIGFKIELYNFSNKFGKKITKYFSLIEKENIIIGKK